MSDYDDFNYYISGGGGGDVNNNRPVLKCGSSSQLTSLHIHIVPVSKLSKLFKRTQGPSGFNIPYVRC
jgi:hypothetical protein